MAGLVAGHAVGAGAEAAAWGLPTEASRSRFPFPFLSLLFSGWSLGELMEEEGKASEGCCPSIPPSVAPHQAPLRHPPVAPDPLGRPAPGCLHGACASASLRQEDQPLEVGLVFCPGFSPDPFLTCIFFSLGEVLLFRFELFDLSFMHMHL